MTERLYYTDSYLATFTAAIVARDDDGRRVYLDRTAFYPTSGGQPHDTGTLGGIQVLDVVDENDRIAHLLAQPLSATGTVEGVIDWPRRLDHIQQHTGQHLRLPRCTLDAGGGRPILGKQQLLFLEHGPLPPGTIR